MNAAAAPMFNIYDPPTTTRLGILPPPASASPREFFKRFIRERDEEIRGPCSVTDAAGGCRPSLRECLVGEGACVRMLAEAVRAVPVQVLQVCCAAVVRQFW